MWEFFFILWVGGTLRGGFNFVWGYGGNAYCNASLIVVLVGAMAPFWSGDNPFQGLWGARGLGARVPRLPAFILLVWHFTCGFDFRHSLRLPFLAAFAVLGGLIVVHVWTMGPFWPGDSPFQALREGCGGEGGTCGLCPKSRARCLRASTSEVYPAGVALYLSFRF